MANNQKIIGGWSQYWDVDPPESFTCAMYGMITSLDSLTNPGCKSPDQKPSYPEQAKALWVYGGQGCTPTGYPTDEGVKVLVNATVKNGWAGVDFDDECCMDISNIIKAMKQLQRGAGECSYTFLAGADYVDQGVGAKEVQDISNAGCCDRFALMCYGDKMWDDATIERYVDPAIKKTIDIVGDKSKVILALTPMGLNSTNLNMFLDCVMANDIGGLFIWEFKELSDADLATIVRTLGVQGPRASQMFAAP